MEPQHEERRLTTILSADVIGYIRLMVDGEAGTLAALKTYHNEPFGSKVAQYRGRTINLTGDGAIVEFVSVVGTGRTECLEPRPKHAANSQPDVEF